MKHVTVKRQGDKLHGFLYYNSLTEFYEDVYKPVPGHNAEYYKRNMERDQKDFKGLTIEEIERYKYGYPDGIKELEKYADLEQPAGGSQWEYKYNDTDGETMNMARFYEGSPAMIQRRRIHGPQGSSKFVEVRINLGETAGVKYEKMIFKTYAATKIVDSLERMGYRCAVYVDDLTERPGNMPDGRKLHYMDITIKLKDFRDPLNLSALINAVSPWMFRHWFFILMCGKYNARPSLGGPRNYKDKTTPGKILIDTGQCLSKKDADEFIKTLNLRLETGEI